jgi:hypothetical protein
MTHNHTLKNIFKGAATTVIAQLGESEPLHQDVTVHGVEGRREGAG